MDITNSFNRRIDPLLNKLLHYFRQNERPTSIKLDQAQKLLDKIADNYQASEDIGKDLYKLYLAQSLIHYFRKNLSKAYDFLQEAKRYSVNQDTVFIESILAPLGQPKSVKTDDDIPATIQQNNDSAAHLTTLIQGEATKTILMGLGLVVVSLVITIVSFNLTDAGGEFFIFWGLGLWGLLLVARGVYSYANPYSLLSDEFRRQSILKNRAARGILAASAAVVTTGILGFALIVLLAPDLADQIENSNEYIYTLEDYNKSLVDGCTAESGNRTYCACAADYLTSHYSLDRLTELENAMTVDDSYTPPEFSGAIANCEYLLQ